MPVASRLAEPSAEPAEVETPSESSAGVARPRDLKAISRLEHLILDPWGGLGDRLRAMAGAKRLCALAGARCTVAWRDPDLGYRSLLAPDPAVGMVTAGGQRVPDGLRRLKMPLFQEGGGPHNRRVPISEDRALHVSSGFFFCAEEEPLVDARVAMRPWLPRPAEDMLRIVHSFVEANFESTVGMHLRQGDNWSSLIVPSLEPFLREAERIMDEGRSLFLSTDSVATETMMKRRFGPRVLTFPKVWQLPFRFPQQPSHIGWSARGLVEDFIDLQLLAASDYVIGTSISSFSQVAIAYNGSPSSRLIEGPPLDPVHGRYQPGASDLLT